MVSLLTSSGDSEGHSAWMPRTNTGHLTQTLVGLTWQLGGVPSGCDTLVTSALGDTDGVNHLVLREDLID